MVMMKLALVSILPSMPAGFIASNAMKKKKRHHLQSLGTASS